MRPRASADSETAQVVAHARALHGNPAEWAAHPAHTSVALAAMDAVWGINARWASVRNVLDRYRTARRLAGADPETDGPDQLIATIDSAGGAEAFAELVGNRQRTSTTNGILKADAVRRAAVLLRDAAAVLGVPASALDAAIWSFQSARAVTRAR